MLSLTRHLEAPLIRHNYQELKSDVDILALSVSKRTHPTPQSAQRHHGARCGPRAPGETMRLHPRPMKSIYTGGGGLPGVWLALLRASDQRGGGAASRVPPSVTTGPPHPPAPGPPSALGSRALHGLHFGGPPPRVTAQGAAARDFGLQVSSLTQKSRCVRPPWRSGRRAVWPAVHQDSVCLCPGCAHF